MGNSEQVIAAQHDGQDIHLHAAQRLDCHINLPAAPGDLPAIFSLVEDLPAMFLQQPCPADGLRVLPTRIRTGIIAIGIGISIA